MFKLISFENLKVRWLLNRLRKNKIPHHVAIIMDGNGRWAKRRGLPRLAGHRAGVETIRRIVEIASQAGIRYLTLYAFSAENWLRPESEVKGLMGLFEEMIQKEAKSLVKKGVKLRAIGQLDRLPPSVKTQLDKVISLTSGSEKLVLTLALSYGGKQEILDAATRLTQDAQAGQVDLKKLSEKDFEKYLYDPNLPPVDLLIRTSGELRISNFLLWQAAYAEFWVTRTLWPDFKKSHFLKALTDYQARQRRFGRVNGEEKNA
jgi:undecaprenyl diphosphate synthase